MSLSSSSSVYFSLYLSVIPVFLSYLVNHFSYRQTSSVYLFVYLFLFLHINFTFPLVLFNFHITSRKPELLCWKFQNSLSRLFLPVNGFLFDGVCPSTQQRRHTSLVILHQQNKDYVAGSSKSFSRTVFILSIYFCLLFVPPRLNKERKLLLWSYHISKTMNTLVNHSNQSIVVFLSL